MHDLIAIAALLASAYICARLLTYRRGPASRHRPLVAWCAWLLVAATGGNALHLMLRGPSAALACPWSLCVLGVLAFLTWRARGNLAHLLRGA